MGNSKGEKSKKIGFCSLQNVFRQGPLKMVDFTLSSRHGRDTFHSSSTQRVNIDQNIPTPSSKEHIASGCEAISGSVKNPASTCFTTDYSDDLLESEEYSGFVNECNQLVKTSSSKEPLSQYLVVHC